MGITQFFFCFGLGEGGLKEKSLPNYSSVTFSTPDILRGKCELEPESWQNKLFCIHKFPEADIQPCKIEFDSVQQI